MKKQLILMISLVMGFAAGVSIIRQREKKAKQKEKEMSEKHLALFLMMNQWVQVKQEGKKLADYLSEHGYKNIAVYGMSFAGERLVNELRGTDIHISYGIDKQADTLYSEIDLVSLEDEWKEVDAIIVTAITFFDEIEKMLSQRIYCPILSLEYILYEI